MNDVGFVRVSRKCFCEDCCFLLLTDFQVKHTLYCEFSLHDLDLIVPMLYALEGCSGVAVRFLPLNWRVVGSNLIRSKLGSDISVKSNYHRKRSEAFKTFTYLGSRMDNTWTSETEVMRRIRIAREFFFSLTRNIWSTNIQLHTKVCLYKAYIMPVLLYGAETWTLTATLERKLDAFQLWCQKNPQNTIQLTHD